MGKLLRCVCVWGGGARAGARAGRGVCENLQHVCVCCVCVCVCVLTVYVWLGRVVGQGLEHDTEWTNSFGVCAVCTCVCLYLCVCVYSVHMCVRKILGVGVRELEQDTECASSS